MDGEKHQRALAAGFLVAVLLCAGWETAAGLWQQKAVASRADWQEAAAAVRAEFRPGDLIAFAPAWADQLGRAELGDLMPLSMVGRPDGRAYRRIFEVAIRGAHIEEAKGLNAEWSADFGRVRAARYSQRSLPVEIPFDLVERFSEAHTAGGPVERRMLEIDYQPRYGLSLRIVTGPPTSLHWDNIPDEAWRGSQLSLWLGLHDYYARKNATGPADVLVDLDEGAVRVPLQVELGRGLQQLVLALPQRQGRKNHTIRIEATAASPPHHFVGVLGRIERGSR